MTATPLRQGKRPTAPSRSADEVAAPLSAQQSGTGLLLGLLGVVGAFAAVPLAINQPAVGVLLLLLGLTLLVVLMVRRGRHQDHADDDLWAGIPGPAARPSGTDDFLSDPA